MPIPLHESAGALAFTIRSEPTGRPRTVVLLRGDGRSVSLRIHTDRQEQVPGTRRNKNPLSGTYPAFGLFRNCTPDHHVPPDIA